MYTSEGRLVTAGIYHCVWHPQYAGIYVVTLAFMIQRPTLTTLALWPFVIAMYYRLARKEERTAVEQFGDRYREYMQRTPMFFPRLFRRHVGQPAHQQ